MVQILLDVWLSEHAMACMSRVVGRRARAALLLALC
jgi:hypothetical protein